MCKFMTRKERFPVGKREAWKLHLDVFPSHILLNFSSVQQSQIVIFTFCMFLDSICVSFMSQFQFCNSQICSEGYIFRYPFFLVNSTRRFTLMESLLQNFVFSFLLSHMLNKFLFTENNFLPSLIKQENCRSSHCIFQSGCFEYTQYKNSPKECPQGINQAINYATYLLVINICLRNVIGRNT